MKITKRLPSGSLSRVAIVDSPIDRDATRSASLGAETKRAGRFYLGRYLDAERTPFLRLAFTLADGSRFELSAEDARAVAEYVAELDAAEAESRARHDAADAYGRHREAYRTAAELARKAGQPAAELPRPGRYASPEAQAEADAAAVAAAVPAPSPVAWQPDPRTLGGYLANFGRDGWRYSVRPLGKRGGYALATFDGYGVAHASLAEYATLLEAMAAAEAHAGGNWPAGAGIRWEPGDGSRSARFADVPGGRLSVQRREPHSRRFRAAINGEHVGTRTSCQAAMAAAVAEYTRRRQGPDTLRDAPGRVA